ncbi:response regulator transcription factor [Paenibacillus filicis]|uniref:Response regulator transcription factor n=1 Tax=Paenibacillus gyeongsangnamensis TaxID=3388067 RepID=A0ABT4QI61_9BACL|nr:response regulator transcription factor [Paenibacillus filicis]MCZ8516554.1 response regulator transcription factor [Paenibacillus filicis]
MSHTILIADDEKEIVEILSLYLEKEGFQTVTAHSGSEAIAAMGTGDIDLAVLDIMMPDMNGFQVIKEIRLTRNIPIILLSARIQDHDKILGLGLGADDYMTKPFNPLEVIARIQAQLRRYYQLNPGMEPGKPSHTLRIGALTLDTNSCQLYKNGAAIPLTSTEFKLLRMLMEHPDRVFTKKQIYESVWGDFYGADDNTVMVCISKLRDKIESESEQPYLITIRGLGYKMRKV